VEGKTSGKKNYNTAEGGGLKPPPVGGTVMIEQETCDASGNCTVHEKPVSVICLGASCIAEDDTPLGARKKIWWYNDHDD
ncbi:hypothetical protein N9498_00630, partial [Porticoccaceae bacterium]|nr:hypothetical protein [Porticoccaceae bacterium]